MQEYLLYSQIPYERHKQVLHILAGVTGSRAVEFGEQNLVYQQLKPADIKALKRDSTKPLTGQTQTLSYQRLVRDCGPDVDSKAPSQWRLRVEEMPEAGVKNVTSRSVIENQIHDQDVTKFGEASEWYRFIRQFVLLGTRFINGNVIIRVSQIMVLFQASPGISLEAPVPSQDDLRPLDPSGAYLIEACVRVEDGASTQLRDKAVNELVAFSKILEGAVDLRVADRLCLDPRIKPNRP